MKNIPEKKLEDKQKTCQNSSCSCSGNNETIKDLTAVSASNKSSQETIKELDPTHFGDWQVKGRAIDF